MSYPNPIIARRTCPTCGKVNKPVATTCEACGTSLPEDGFVSLAAPGSPLAAEISSALKPLKS